MLTCPHPRTSAPPRGQDLVIGGRIARAFWLAVVLASSANLRCGGVNGSDVGQGSAADGGAADRVAEKPLVLQAEHIGLLVDDVEASGTFPPGCRASDPGCLRAQTGYEVILVWLNRQDAGDPAEVASILVRLRDQIWMQAPDRTRTRASGAGMQNRRLFVMFTPSAGLQEFILEWPGGAPATLRVRRGPTPGLVDAGSSMPQSGGQCSTCADNSQCAAGLTCESFPGGARMCALLQGRTECCRQISPSVRDCVFISRFVPPDAGSPTPPLPPSPALPAPVDAQASSLDVTPSPRIDSSLSVPDRPQSCGLPGATCCAGGSCNGGGCCIGGSCVGAGDTCSVNGMRCEYGSCGVCGGPGQPCCPDRSCTASAVACDQDICRLCGMTGAPCCAGKYCAAGSVCGNRTTCEPCGSRGQPCCAANACASALSCGGGVCGAQGASDAGP